MSDYESSQLAALKRALLAVAAIIAVAGLGTRHLPTRRLDELGAASEAASGEASRAGPPT